MEIISSMKTQRKICKKLNNIKYNFFSKQFYEKDF